MENKIVDDIVNNKQSNTRNTNYIAVLEIPTINLKKGLVHINSKYNHVDKNIQIISGDIYNLESNSIILAAHSGTGYKAFFKNLYKLELGNYAHVYYNNKKFNYIVSDIYAEKKDGNIEIPASNNLLVLTTCYKGNKQLVVILQRKDYVKST